MSAVDALAALLAPAPHVEAVPTDTSGIDALIERLRAQVRIGSAPQAPQDLQRLALQHFWQTPQFDSLRNARGVAFGLGLAVGTMGERVLDDARRFGAVLSGADAWLDRPRWYRRCYQGLLWSYFNIDTEAEGTSPAARRHWLVLRDYLKQRAPKIVDPQLNPDWVDAVATGLHLFGDAPTEPYVDGLLQGDRQALDLLIERVGIQAPSWFLRQLIGAQIDAAVALDDAAFCARLPGLLGLLAGAGGLRNACLTSLLQRYAQLPRPPLHEGLRDAAADAWGSPWMAADAWHWDGLEAGVRTLLGDWLKAAVLEAFFARAEDQAPTRRAGFWQRYLRSIRLVRLAAGATACAPGAAAGPTPMPAMPSILARLRDPMPTDTVLVLTIGCALVVACGDPNEPLRVHDLRRPLPFDIDRPLTLEPNGVNSLRTSAAALVLDHRDGLLGWRQWEQMFEAALKEHFDIRPGAPNAAAGWSGHIDLSDALPVAFDSAGTATAEQLAWPSASAGEDVHWQTAEAASLPYSRPDLEVFARVHALPLDDQLRATGKLWVRAAADDRRIARVLTRWGFSHIAGAGWWR